MQELEDRIVLARFDTVWNTGRSTFHVGFLLGQLPGNMLLTRTNPLYFLPRLCLCTVLEEFACLP
jgi:hypothetical protein